MKFGIREKLVGTFVLVLVVFAAMSLLATSTFTKLSDSSAASQRAARLDDRIMATEIGATNMVSAQWRALGGAPVATVTRDINESYNGTIDDAVLPANAEAIKLAPAPQRPTLEIVRGQLPAIHQQALATVAYIQAGKNSAAQGSIKKSEALLAKMLESNSKAEVAAERMGSVAQAKTISTRKTSDRRMEILSWAGAILMIGLSIGIGWSISRRTRSALVTAKAVSSGDLSVQFAANGSDEIGQLNVASQEMVDYLNEAALCAQQIASGDLSANFTARSENDVLGNALADMIANLREHAAALDELSQGNLNVTVQAHSDSDQLSNSFEAMLAYLRERSDDAGRIAIGDLSHDIAIKSNEDAFGMAFAEMVGNLEQRADEARRIADGDLGVAVVPWSANDGLGLALGQMVDRLRLMIGEAIEVAGSLNLSSQQLSAMSSDVGRGMEEIAGSIGELAAGAESQVRVLEEQRGQATDASMAVERSRMLTQGGLAAVMQASEAMTELDDSSRSITEAIQRLSDKTEQIGGFVGAVSNIADQTNLLALNAAIEAARAGDLGRGFAVVADEVRKLAEESQTATNTIASIVSEIQRETALTVEVIGQSVERTTQGAQVVGEARDAFQLINDSVQESAERIAAIAGSADTVAAVATQSSASTQQVSAATEQTSASMQEMAASSGDLARTAEQLRELTSSFHLESTGGDMQLAGVIDLHGRGRGTA